VIDVALKAPDETLVGHLAVGILARQQPKEEYTQAEYICCEFVIVVFDHFRCSLEYIARDSLTLYEDLWPFVVILPVVRITVVFIIHVYFVLDVPALVKSDELGLDVLKFPYLG